MCSGLILTGDVTVTHCLYRIFHSLGFLPWGGVELWARPTLQPEPFLPVSLGDQIQNRSALAEYFKSHWIGKRKFQVEAMLFFTLEPNSPTSFCL